MDEPTTIGEQGEGATEPKAERSAGAQTGEGSPAPEAASQLHPPRPAQHIETSGELPPDAPPERPPEPRLPEPGSPYAGGEELDPPEVLAEALREIPPGALTPEEARSLAVELLAALPAGWRLIRWEGEIRKLRDNIRAVHLRREPGHLPGSWRGACGLCEVHSDLKP